MTPGYGFGFGWSLRPPGGGGIAIIDPNDLNALFWVRPEELDNPNRLLQTGDLTDAAWTETNVTVTGGQSDPDGGSGAVLVTPTGGAYPSLNQLAQGFQPGSDDYASVYWKRGPNHDGITTCKIRIHDNVANSNYDAVPPTSWERVGVAHTLDASAIKSHLYMSPHFHVSPDTNQDFYLYHPQLEAGTSASAYVENGATAGGLVATWADQSTNGNDATQGTQASMPLVEAEVLDGWSGALFDGVDDDLGLDSAIDFSGAMEYWAVVQRPTSAAATVFIGGGSAQDYIYTDGSNRIIFKTDQGALVISGNDVFSDDTPFLLRVRRDVSHNLVCEINGTGVTSGVANKDGTFSAAFIGGTGVGLPWDGHILEAILMGEILTYAEHRNLLLYIDDKYPSLGVTLPPPLEDPETLGNVVLLLDETSTYTESTPGNNDIVSMVGSEATPVTTLWVTSNGELRNPASANFNGYPTIWRGNASEFFDYNTGTEIVLSDMTFVMVLRPTTMSASLAPFEYISGAGGILIPTDGSIDFEGGSGSPLQVAPNGTIVNSSTNVIIVTASIGSHAAGRTNGAAKVEPVGTPTGNVTINRLSSALSASGDWEWATLAIYNEVLSDADVTLLGQSLSNKYGLGQTW